MEYVIIFEGNLKGSESLSTIDVYKKDLMQRDFIIQYGSV